MRLNEDVTKRAVVHAAAEPWVPSPAAGIDRRMLFRIGAEQARATSIVRYAPHSRFAFHQHPGGEEILVLDGVFEDDSGAYPAGSYLRNPPGTGHAPGSAGGCTIFVRLWQFRATDHTLLALPPAEAGGVLFDDGHEQVRLEHWPAGHSVTITNPEGLELLVLAGSFHADGAAFIAQSWLRLPAGSDLHAEAGSDGATVWLRAGPALHSDICAFAD